MQKNWIWIFVRKFAKFFSRPGKISSEKFKADFLLNYFRDEVFGQCWVKVADKNLIDFFRKNFASFFVLEGKTWSKIFN